ncbi:MAG: type II toxin-antitoxin system VapC family toxin [Candidatus Eremiobacterota bacterium]
MNLFHLDTDFLIWALEAPGTQRRRLLELVDSGAEVGMSAVAWYEFSRGPRTPNQLAVARSFFSLTGILGFSEELAARSADVFRSLGCPRNRANDIAIGVSATASDAILLTRNTRDFDGIPGLKLECGL